MPSSPVRRIYGDHPLMAMGFALLRKLARMTQPSMRFVFLGSGFCIRLPSDLASRQAPLPSANRFRHQDLQGTFTLKQLCMPGTRRHPRAHARGTKTQELAVKEPNTFTHGLTPMVLSANADRSLQFYQCLPVVFTRALIHLVLPSTW